MVYCNSFYFIVIKEHCNCKEPAIAYDLLSKTLVSCCIFLSQIDDPIHVISIEEPTSGSRQKPPDYDAVTDAPPSYDDAIKLNPGHLIRSSNNSIAVSSLENPIPGTVDAISSGASLTPPPPYAR